MVPLLVEFPALRAVTIFDELRRRHRKLPASVRRTLERRTRRWRPLHGPEQEVIFAQRNPPGRLGLSDFTATGHLGVTIGGVPLDLEPLVLRGWPAAAAATHYHHHLAGAAGRVGRLPEHRETARCTRLGAGDGAPCPRLGLPGPGI